MFVKPCMESTTNLQLWSSGERTNVYQTELAFHNRITGKYHAVIHMQNAIQGQSFSEQFNSKPLCRPFGIFRRQNVPKTFLAAMFVS